MQLGGWVGLTLLVVCFICLPGSNLSDYGVEEDELDLISRYLEDREILREIELEQNQDYLPKDIDVTLELDSETCKFRKRHKGNRDYAGAVSLDLPIMNECLAKWTHQSALASYAYETNLTEANKKRSDDIGVRVSELAKQVTRMAQQYRDDPRYNSLDGDQQRQLRLLSVQTTPLRKSDLKKLVKISSELQNLYSSATVGGKPLDPYITNRMDKSRDPQELERLWKGWRDVTGPPMKDLYAKFVRLKNIGAKDNGFTDYAQAWMLNQFDKTPNIEEITDKLWSELQPLYKELHAFVRHRLRTQYGNNYPEIFDSGAIPAHLLGNMWAQEWQGIYDLVKPYPDVEEPDYDQAMKKKGYTVDKMFKMSEEFYTSIGLFPMTDKFNKYSMKVRPDDGREVVCHASASDMSTGDDFRIKMCTEIDTTHFETIHHEMGHIEYFMAYRKQPLVYRDGANSAFHEAVGDTIAASVLTPAHLKTIKLTSEADDVADEVLAKKRNLNYLMKRALFKIAFLPFGLLIDKWRWNVFRGIVEEDEYNRYWWYLRLKYQGIVPPVARSARDFDPGAKFHIPSNSPYICYFVSFIIQFQFYESMCKAAGHQGELSTCDFYRSREAGAKLKAALELGKSKPWPDAMEKLTGVRHIDTGSLKRYFEPLEKWLKQENIRTGAKKGWESAKVDWIGD